jgi:hypothetical protein
MHQKRIISAEFYIKHLFFPRRLEPTAVGGGVTARGKAWRGVDTWVFFLCSQYTKEAVKVILHTGLSFCCERWEYVRKDSPS